MKDSEFKRTGNFQECVGFKKVGMIEALEYIKMDKSLGQIRSALECYGKQGRYRWGSKDLGCPKKTGGQRMLFL